MEGPDRFSIIAESNFPIQTQHYPPFQNPEPYKFAYDSHANMGEAPSTLQKQPNHRLYMPRPPCGYDFAVPSYLGSGSYTALYKDPSSPQAEAPEPSKVSSGLGTSTATTHTTGVLSGHDRNNYDTTSKHHGWKQILGKGTYSERGEYGQFPGNTNHHYYNSEYPCRYPGPAPATPAALQTIITTTTKVSYQPCPKSSVVKYSDNIYDVKGLPSCSSLLEDTSPTSYSDLKIPEDSGVIKSALSYQPETLPAKIERAENCDTYRYSSYASNSYPDRVSHPLRYDGVGY